jgi:hypothetical protein
VDELVEWLRVQIDEDERVAREAPFALDDESWPFWTDVDDQDDYRTANQWRDRFKPARVLREVEAKRRILGRCIQARADQGIYSEDGQAAVAEDVLKLMALPYSDRSDYQEEWRP